MSRYLLAPEAWEDLDELQRYLLSERPEAVGHVMAGLRRGMEFVAEDPRVGRQRRFGDRLLRVWVVWSWVIIYDDSREPVEVVRIIHGARDFEQIFE